MEKQLISVIIPTYNRETTILRSVNSVLHQDYENIELLIIDDNSTDCTRDIVLSINDSRIKYIKNITNLGACASRNIGIDFAKGNYVAFQDSDDSWRPNKLSNQVEDLLKHNADIVFCSMLNTNTKTIFPKEKIDYSKSVHSQFLEHNKAGTQTILGKSEIFKNNKFDETMPRFQEWELMIRLSKYYRIFHTDQVLVDYYIQSDSISMNFEKGLNAILKIYDKNKAEIDNDKKIKKVFLSTISQYLIATKKNATGVLFKSLWIRFDLKTFIKLILCIFGLSSVIRYRWKLND